MEYLFLLLPISLLFLSWKNNVKYNRMKNTGKIPVIMAARRNTTLYLVLALTVASVFFMFLAYTR